MINKKIFLLITFISIFTLLTKNSSAKQLYYKWVFDKGATTNFDNAPNAKSVKDTLNIVFEDINYNQGKARQVGVNGSQEVLVHALTTINFMEVTGSGNMTFTTIFPNPKSRYNAVHSRHMDISGPIVSQYYGICN